MAPAPDMILSPCAIIYICTGFVMENENITQVSHCYILLLLLYRVVDYLERWYGICSVKTVSYHLDTDDKYRPWKMTKNVCRIRANCIVKKNLDTVHECLCGLGLQDIIIHLRGTIEGIRMSGFCHLKRKLKL